MSIIMYTRSDRNGPFLSYPQAYAYAGARVGDTYMSLIYTAELNGANPFDYLTELQRHADQVRSAPSQWMPWNYRATLAELDDQAASDRTPS